MSETNAVAANFKPRVAVLQSNSNNCPQNYFVFSLIDSYSNDSVKHLHLPQKNSDGQENLVFDISGSMSGTVTSVPLQSFIHGYDQEKFVDLQYVTVNAPNGTTSSGDIKHIPPVRGDEDPDFIWIGEEQAAYAFGQCRTFVIKSATVNNCYFVCGLVDVPQGLVLSDVQTEGANIIVTLSPPPESQPDDKRTKFPANAQTYFVQLQASTPGQFSFMYVDTPPASPNISYSNPIKL